MTAQPSITESPALPGDPCPVCGAQAQRGQLVCLECGSRVTLAYRRPPSWKIPVAITAAVLLLAVAGGAVAYQAIDDDAKREAGAAPANPRESAAVGGEEPAPTPTDAGEPEDRPGTGDAADSNEQTRDGTPGDAADDAPTRADPSGDEDSAGGRGDEAEPAGGADDGGLVRRGDLYTWPQSLQAFTVVLLSSEDRPSATSFARSAGGSERNKIGVIASNDFQTLPQNFFVVFSGEYENRGEADRAAARLSGRFPGAFAQLVRR